MTGSGNQYLLELLVYRDMPLENLVFYGCQCPHARHDDRPVQRLVSSTEIPYYGEGKDWYRFIFDISFELSFPARTSRLPSRSSTCVRSGAA